MKILVMMTGGTISTTKNECGHLFANGKKTVSLLAEELSRRGRYDVDFEYMHPLDVLSENMTFPRLNILLEAFRTVDKKRYGAVIVAHGTDTLAYTASLLALVLAGWWDKPVFLVSSDYTLSDPRANGHDNFKAAVDLALKRFGGGVYVPYRNSDGITYLHRGAHLRQCGNFTSDFYSSDMYEYTGALPYRIQAEHPMLYQNPKLSECVMRIEPYVGIDYSRFCLDGVKAVLHGSYHSSTACAERSVSGGAYTKRSVLYLADECKKHGVELFLSPLPEYMRETLGVYSTTADIIAHGANPVFGLTDECAYMKLCLAYALGYEGEEVAYFLEREVASEKLR